MAASFVAFVMILGTMQPGQAGDDELRFRAQLIAPASAGDVSGQADFRLRDGQRKFSAEVEGSVPGEMFDVVVAGEIVGKVTIDALGVGDLNFDDNFEAGLDDPATQFPANFPAIDGGEMVVVGPLSGTLQPK
jgi:hypothetical protein